MSDDTTNRPLSADERRALITAPVRVGILNETFNQNRYAGAAASGFGGPREPVLGKYGRITGWKAATRKMQ